MLQPCIFASDTKRGNKLSFTIEKRNQCYEWDGVNKDFSEPSADAAFSADHLLFAALLLFCTLLCENFL